MAFPTSPSNGDKYTTGFGTVYEYVAADDKWVIINDKIVEVVSDLAANGDYDGHVLTITH